MYQLPGQYWELPGSYLGGKGEQAGCMGVVLGSYPGPRSGMENLLGSYPGVTWAVPGSYPVIDLSTHGGIRVCQ